MEKEYTVPFDRETAAQLKAGDCVYLTGTIYTARDAAHKRMQEALDRGEELPFDVSGNIIYYMGPSPAREGQVIGSAGPTTASRMDKYTPALLDLGLRGMIGKGKEAMPSGMRSSETERSISPPWAERAPCCQSRLFIQRSSPMKISGRKRFESLRSGTFL